MEKGYVKVVNHGQLDYTEEFDGQIIHIPAGKHVEMPRSKANAFLSVWRPFTRDGAVSAQGRKPLHMEEDPEEHAEKRDQPFKYQATDGTKFRTKQGLLNYEEKMDFKSGVKVGKSNRTA